MTFDPSGSPASPAIARYTFGGTRSTRRPVESAKIPSSGSNEKQPPEDKTMYKIRLYVVPEQEEHPPEDVEIDEEDSPHPPPMMQRRNSRRPGAVRLNVIQKDRRCDPVAPKLRQIRQRVNVDASLQNGLSASMHRSDHRKENFDSRNEGRDGPPSVVVKCAAPPSRLDASVPRKTVFASPKIKQLALNLQEKMLERNAKMSRPENAQGEPQPLRVAPKKASIRDESKASCTLSPILENRNGTAELEDASRNEADDPRSGRATSNNLNKRPGAGAGAVLLGKNCRNEQLHGSSPKIVRVKSADGDGARTAGGQTVNGSGNSVVLRRKNKQLNGYREYDLEQKIEVEIKMREGSARLLAAARHRAQSLEAARALLTSNERMSAYMAELQRRKREPSNKPSYASTARVSLSELRVPLMWRDSDHFKNRGDYRRFAVFCLARVGTEIHDTALLCPVDRALTDISFPDVLVFNNVPAEFELTLEIYSHILQEDLSIASTPRRIKRTIHSSISKTVGKKLAASLRDELNSGKIGPHFELMASAKLTLDETDDNIHTHDLVINNLENKHHALPLFGHFCCRLAAQPECVSKEVCAGNITLDGRNCFARLQSFALQSWESRKLADEEQSPIHSIPINRETLVQPSKSSPKELKVVNNVEGTEKTTTIRLDSGEEAQRWLRHLATHGKDHLRWKHAAESIQDVPCVESARNSFISNKRQGSLYDETPLIETVQSDYSASRPTVQEIFGLTPSTSFSSCSSTNSPPSLRSRSLSTNGPRKLSASTLMSHWPFSNKSHD